MGGSGRVLLEVLLWNFIGGTVQTTSILGKNRRCSAEVWISRLSGTIVEGYGFKNLVSKNLLIFLWLREGCMDILYYLANSSSGIFHCVEFLLCYILKSWICFCHQVEKKKRILTWLPVWTIHCLPLQYKIIKIVMFWLSLLYVIP